MLKSSLSTLTLVAAAALFPLAAHAQSPAGLPDGNGKDLVAGICAGCHAIDLITRSSGYSRDHWKELIGTMVDLSAPSAQETQAAITQYLAEKFPPNTRRAPTPVPGPVQIEFKEWVTPTFGQRTRDPVEGVDGKVWWVGQFGNLLGRLDMATGEMKEWPLPANANPHSVTPDAHGNAWYTGNKNGTMGKFDPKTEKITEYKMPDPNVKDPHTAEFDRNGIMWFTAQHANVIGRLDPKTGDIKLDAEGTPWVSCNGAPCLIKVDPLDMKLTEIRLPIAGTTVRRLDIAEDGMIWYVNSGQGKIGRYNPKTGEIKEWDSPSGKSSHPYAIAVINGIVWYNESGMRPDMLVRFDPATETFQSWAIPSGNVYAGIARHIRPTRDGNLLIHQTSTNRIMLVTVKNKAAARQ
jgi:virginiamycin B lyase